MEGASRCEPMWERMWRPRDGFAHRNAGGLGDGTPDRRGLIRRQELAAWVGLGNEEPGKLPTEDTNRHELERRKARAPRQWERGALSAPMDDQAPSALRSLFGGKGRNTKPPADAQSRHGEALTSRAV